MELILNLGWIAAATAIVWLCARHAPRTDGGRWTQIVALAVVILILFPVISVTDDLLAAQSPTELESYQRKDHAFANVQPTPLAMLVFILPGLAELSCGLLSIRVPDSLLHRRSGIRLYSAIQNRPPPSR